MKPRINIAEAWACQNTLLEYYRYIPQHSEKLPAHCHDQYQFCLSVNYPSESYYRKSVHFVPVGSLSIVHPGEMHSGTGRNVGDLKTPPIFRMMYLAPESMSQLQGDAFEQPRGLPFFANSIILNSSLAQAFLRFHQASQRQVSQLEQDESLQSFLLLLLRQQTNQVNLQPIGQERSAVRRVRDFLHDHYAENVSLKQLAQLVNLSPSYFSRVFKAEMGVSLPHYQTQIRINEVRSLLTKGVSIKQAAARTGFVDQSHITHQFKRFVQVTPGNYRRSLKSSKNLKNLQDYSE